ncbi:MAG: methylmalonyl Co-A mutase-associated GTPase MeaB [Neomegalonema sp.]|nr:methylmalonyl Co-A mutase-associated GTPase MeaB [Neomegalonema sp.]
MAGDRRALSRAITLVESSRPDHRQEALQLLAHLHRISDRRALRLGLTGTPGVGKSTFTECFGTHLTGTSERVAVLAVDPSSARSGGSILGDKTRMEKLSRDPNAFIRPSPSGNALGGVARRTRECIALCEAAGYSVIIVETVGVGQSETMVADMTDIFVLLLAPAGGDELQGVKRGVMEMADFIVVNKADGDLKSAAMRTVADYSGALGLLRKRDQDPENVPAVMPLSAATGMGVDDLWKRLRALDAWRSENGWSSQKRRDQATRAMHREIERRILDTFEGMPETKQTLCTLDRAVREGALSPDEAADRALAVFLETLKGA